MRTTKEKWSQKKTKEEMEDGARRTIARFRRACATYDSGMIEEADHLSSLIYMIVSDTGEQLSAASQLGVLKKLRFRAEFQREPESVTFNPPLVGVYMSPNGKASWVPITGECPASIMTDKFDKWWKGIVYKNISGQILSRQTIVTAMRNHDAGGHSSDRWKDEAYFRFLTYSDHVNTSANGNLSIFIQNQSRMDNRNLHYKTMRTIAWELDCSLRLAGI